MRLLSLMLAICASWPAIASAEVSDSQTPPGMSWQEYVPDEGGRFTQLTATGYVDDMPVRFVDLGPLPAQFGAAGESYVEALATNQPDAIVADARGLVDLGDNYRRSLLYELPTFLEYPQGPRTLIAVDDPGGGGPDGEDPGGLPEVPLPAAGFLLLSAIVSMALRRRAA